jgi:hypothetical protein
MQMTDFPTPKSTDAIKAYALKGWGNMEKISYISMEFAKQKKPKIKVKNVNKFSKTTYIWVVFCVLTLNIPIPFSHSNQETDSHKHSKYFCTSGSQPNPFTTK